MADFDWSPYAMGGATRADSFSGMNGGFQSALRSLFSSAPPSVQRQLGVYSGYRSNARQAQLYQQALQKYGSPERARQWVAPPGNSQHNKGFAADLKYLSPSAKSWVKENAAAHGLSFPLKNEPWHVELATARNPGAVVRSPRADIAPSALSYSDDVSAKKTPAVNAFSKVLPQAPQAASATGIMSVINPATPTAVQRTSLLDATPNMSAAAQRAAYGQGQVAAANANGLLGDVAGYDPGYNDRLKAQDIAFANTAIEPATAAGLAAKNALRTGLLAQVPQPDPTVTAATVQAPEVTRPATTATAAPTPQQMAQAGILASGPVTPNYALGAKVDRDLSRQKMAGTLLGGVLGGLLGPLGALAGGYVGRNIAAKNYYPEAPKAEEKPASKSSSNDGSLTSYGRSVSNSSGQFSRALSSGKAGLW